MERWSHDGLPQFREEERESLRDFFACYEAHYDALLAETLAAVERIPVLKALMAKMPKGLQEEQTKQSQLLLRRAFFENDWRPLIENQRQQGATYAGLNVPFRDWFDLVGAFQHALVPKIIAMYDGDRARLERVLIALNHYIDVSLSVIGDAYLQAKEKRIAQQAEAIQELSTPVLQVRDRMLLLPIIGILDTHRARTLTESLLRAIRAHRARVVVMDITGVAAVDSKVANHLLQTVDAARLMGARVFVAGLSPEVATALVTLGVDLSRLDTVADLQGGIEDAERLLGLKTVKTTRRGEEAGDGEEGVVDVGAA